MVLSTVSKVLIVVAVVVTLSAIVVYAGSASFMQMIGGGDLAASTWVNVEGAATGAAVVVWLIAGGLVVRDWLRQHK